MLSPSREVLLLRGARFEERETSRETTGNIHTDFHLWKHPDISADCTAASVGHLKVGEMQSGDLDVVTYMCGCVLNLSGAWRVKFCSFLVDALIAYPGPGGDWSDFDMWVFTTHFTVSEERCENMFIQLSDWPDLKSSSLDGFSLN